MTKQEILDYVMKTPQNTNRAVLSGMLDEIGEGGGSDSGLIVVNMVVGTARDTYGNAVITPDKKEYTLQCETSSLGGKHIWKDAIFLKDGYEASFMYNGTKYPTDEWLKLVDGVNEFYLLVGKSGAQTAEEQYKITIVTQSE